MDVGNCIHTAYVRQAGIRVEVLLAERASNMANTSVLPAQVLVVKIGVVRQALAAVEGVEQQHVYIRQFCRSGQLESSKIGLRAGRLIAMKTHWRSPTHTRCRRQD